MKYNLIFVTLVSLFFSCNRQISQPLSQSPATYGYGGLELSETYLKDLGDSIHYSFYNDRIPKRKLKFAAPTPMINGLWNAAIADVESLIRYYGKEKVLYLGAGEKFQGGIWTRDVAYAGILGLNQVFPKEMRSSLRLTREIRDRAGLSVPACYYDNGFEADWIKDGGKQEWKEKYFTGPLIQRTDDVVWVWAYYDLIKNSKKKKELEYLYETSSYFFEKYYDIFYDPTDGLYFGQASFIDIFMGEPQKWLDNTDKTTGYPQHWTYRDCIHIKTPSTNALYYKALIILSEVANRLGKTAESQEWKAKAEKLKASYLEKFIVFYGGLSYYIHPTEGKANKHEALGTALAVLSGLLTGEKAVKAIDALPKTEKGVPVFYPFFDHGRFYHNDSSWPFVDAFFFWAKEEAGIDHYLPLHLANNARVTKKDATFHEVVKFSTGEIRGSKSQLWSAAGFINACIRSGWVR